MKSYVKQLEEANAALKEKLETIFEWREVTVTYWNDTTSRFVVTHECYIHGELFAKIGKNESMTKQYIGVCKNTTIFDNDMESLKQNLQMSYMSNFYMK